MTNEKLKNTGNIIITLIIGLILILFTMFGLAGLSQMDLKNLIITIVVILAVWIGFGYSIYKTFFSN